MRELTKLSLAIMVFTIGLMTTSCLEELADTDKIASSKIRPKVEFPIANSTFTFGDLIEKAQGLGFVEEQNNQLILVYEDQLLTQPAQDLFAIPDQGAQAVSLNGLAFPFLPPGASATVIADQTFVFNPSGSEQLDSVILKDGKIDVAITSNFPADIALTLRLPTIEGQAGIVQKTFNYIYSSGTTWNVNDSIPLQGTRVDLTNGGVTTNELRYIVEAQVTDRGQPLNGTHSLDISFQLGRLRFRIIFGNLGTGPVFSRRDTIVIDALKNVQSGVFEPEEPRIILTFNNEFGINAAVDIRSVGVSNPSGSIMLSGPVASAPQNPHILLGPTLSQIGQSVSSVIDINSGNSNIVPLVNSIPHRFFYGFDGVLNPPAASTAKHFALDTSKIRINWRLEVPLYGKVRDFVLTRTFAFDGFDVTELDNIIIKQTSINEFPLEVRMQAYFLDNVGTVLDSLYKDINPTIIGSAPVDVNGLSTGPTEVKKDTPLTVSQTDAIKNASQLLLVAVFNTAQNGTVPIRIRSTDKLTIRMGIKATAEYQLN